MEGAGCDNSFVFDDVANLHSFLAMNKDSKANCQNIEYSLNTLTELNRVWNVDMSMAVSYAEDFDIIKKNHSANDRTVRPDKYITVTFDEIAQELEWRQSVPDYVFHQQQIVTRIGPVKVAWTYLYPRWLFFWIVFFGSNDLTNFSDF